MSDELSVPREEESTATGAVRTYPSEGVFDPGACRIGERELWIANKDAVNPEMLEALNLDPEYVVSVNRDSTPATTDHFTLDDGYINPYSEFTAAVEAARKRIRDDGTVVVNCAAGISRSATIIATALAVEEARPFAAVVKEIRETREYARPNYKLVVSACRYLIEHDNREAELRETDREQAHEASAIVTDELSLDSDEEERLDAILSVVEDNSPECP